MNIALKEWASLVEALAQGRQIALLRKGGIVEAARQGFELRHPQFLFFPTHEHQHASLIQPAWHTLVQPPEPGTLHITLLAKVDVALPAPPDRDTLLHLGDQFIWNEAFVHQRYDYRPDLPLWLILLRAYNIPPVTIPDRPSYAGCKSWVNLTEEIDIDAAIPVLSEEQHNAKKSLLLA